MSRMGEGNRKCMIESVSGEWTGQSSPLSNSEESRSDPNERSENLPMSEVGEGKWSDVRSGTKIMPKSQSDDEDDFEGKGDKIMLGINLTEFNV